MLSPTPGGQNESCHGQSFKIQVPTALRQKVREFYVDLLGCQSLPAPSAALDLFQFACGFIFGVSFAEPAKCLPDNELLKATWLELKTDHPDILKQKLLAFGVKEIQYPDKSHFYFQAPGGHVFRIAAA